MASFGLFKWLIIRQIHFKDVRNGSDEAGPVGCQMFGGHKNHGLTVKDSLKRSRNKRYRDDS